MKNKRKQIREIFSPPPAHMVGDGFRVHNFFPGSEKIGLQGMSPFFLLDYNSLMTVPPSDRPKGVGVHPHRGLETVTIAYHGKIAHHDSAGNSGIIGEGDVQWMTAGGGVLHKEYHEKEFSRKGGLFQMVQLWTNLPSKYKMTPAKYQSIENKEMGKYMLDNRKGVVEIIAGQYNGVKGPATTFTPMNLFNARLMRGASAEFTFSEKCNTGMLLIKGEAKINNTPVMENHFTWFANDGETILTEADSDSVILILSGDPVNEPVAAYGPFLMNTKEEIQKAFDDYYDGIFGYLED